jgi:hypothetical protein
MWTVTITHADRTVTTAAAATREDARRWARQYRAAGDTVTITGFAAYVDSDSSEPGWADRSLGDDYSEPE